MSIFQKRELSTCGGTEPTPPRAAVCFTTSAMTRRAADWLARLGGCRPLGILSDHGEDVIWQCEAENVDLLLLETDFSPAAEDTKDVSARCDIAIEVRRRLPECKVYLACEDGWPGKAARAGQGGGAGSDRRLLCWQYHSAADAHMAERSGRGHAPTGEPP